MINQSCKIYKLSNGTDDLIYIGKTVRTLKYRLCKHITDYNRWRRGQSSFLSSFILFNMFGTENVKIELVENCIDDKDMTEKEQYYIKKFNTCNKLNGNKSYLNSMD